MICDQCGYSLQGLDKHGRCPECGRLIEWSIIAQNERRREESTRTWRDSRLTMGIAAFLLLSILLVVLSAAHLMRWDVLLGYSLLVAPVIAIALAIVQFGNMRGRLRGPCFGWIAFAAMESAVLASALIAIGLANRIFPHP